MSQISAAVKARQTKIAQLQRQIETLQRAASIMGGGEIAPAKAKQKSKPKAKATQPSRPQAKPTQKATPQPTPKRRPMTAAQRIAVGKRMKAYWAKRKKASAATAATPAQPTPKKRKRKPMSAAAKKAMSKRLKASWAKRRKAKG